MKRELIIELTLLVTTAIAFLALVVKSILTGDDIPPTLAYLIGLSWGSLLGVKEVVRRIGGGRCEEDVEE